MLDILMDLFLRAYVSILGGKKEDTLIIEKGK